MIVWWLLGMVFAVSCGLTLVLRRYALAKSLVDIPNQRSSHTVPTPRGGGVAIVAAFSLALPFVGWMECVEGTSLLGVLGGGIIVAIIGFADDHGHIDAKWRLLGHFIAAAWTLYWLNGLAPIQLFGEMIDLSMIGSVLAAFFLVWMLNLYNFMDGIDGLASAEAISACLGMCLVYWWFGTTNLIWGPLTLIGAVAGFFCWNFPPARIFMGDAGSGFLGFILGALALESAWVRPELLWCWIILLGVFIVDATLTLLRRLFRGEKVYQAHRSHAYQHASRRYQSHLAVTSIVVLINLLWLLPIALMVGAGWLGGGLGCLIAFFPLAVLACKFKAGVAS
ncbi:glycosyltransferase family 4 protein [Pseudomonas moraviensis subsp. stanleyae]|uniref:MraY family glycosyltransferase n=1 Tax=Pseudomonas moraviensis TaxID=321662 RepID=UPI002E302ADD|nr:glycosyltransferase family 4 protein [Pseudomonas moraviensis]MED7667596.1 glycosyltransferase family 4 protein [Pseudomonas moraviensis subsp. stanleyae]